MRMRSQLLSRYTISWKRTTTPTIALDNAVEYKSLPSGLHSVPADLVYFTHEGYAGLSAFARGDAGADERGANFVAVGVLARRDGAYGRLGRSWLVAGRLEGMAKALAEDESVAPLEEFWAEQTAHGEARGEEEADGKGYGHSRVRAISTVSAVAKEDERLPAHHPALSILAYVDMFGPLVFRLQQAALLRKRILFVGAPPVRAMCEFGMSPRRFTRSPVANVCMCLVYILSILSSLSARDAELLIPGTDALLRLPTLFSVGVHDIPSLEGPRNNGSDGGEIEAEGWAACTTDEIISTKTKLYDVLVELPQPSDTNTRPRITTSSGTTIKASQRDVARYKLLHKELFKHRNRSQSSQSSPTGPDLRYRDNEDEEEEPLISRDSIDAHRAEDEYTASYDDSVVEPMTWSRLAYSGFMWWASAGESDSHSSRERDLDRNLIGNLSGYNPNIETAIIAYFHRQTSHLVQTLSEYMDSEREENGEPQEGEMLVIGREELSRLGLDAWSEADRAFVSEAGEMWFGRGVEVRGSEVECCGLRVPVM